MVRVVVRDSRLREKDPILGIVNLPLKELLTEGSEVTRLFSLQEGVGFGYDFGVDIMQFILTTFLPLQSCQYLLVVQGCGRPVTF